MEVTLRTESRSERPSSRACVHFLPIPPPPPTHTHRPYYRLVLDNKALQSLQHKVKTTHVIQSHTFPPSLPHILFFLYVLSRALGQRFPTPSCYHTTTVRSHFIMFYCFFMCLHLICITGTPRGSPLLHKMYSTPSQQVVHASVFKTVLLLVKISKFPHFYSCLSCLRASVSRLLSDTFRPGRRQPDACLLLVMR